MSRPRIMRLLRACEVCGRKIEILPSELKYGRGRFCSKPCQSSWQTVPLIDRFFRYVGRKMPNGCIPWTGCGNQYGYGQIGEGTRKGRVLLASHVSYELFVGPIPDGLQVLHRCDLPACIAPTHLFLGTQADNIHDMVAKGRARKRTPGSRRWLRDQRQTVCGQQAGHG